MSGTLSTQEREGLEDVFLSIHTNRQKYEKLKRVSDLLLNKKVIVRIENLYKVLKNGLKHTNTSDFITFFSKTKKHLRK